MASTQLSFAVFEGKASEPGALEELYKSLHSQASATESVFISLTPLPDLLTRLSNLQAEDPGRQLPLHGVPYVIKDNIDAPPHPTTAACPAFSYQPSAPAFVVTQLEAAGAVSLGKVNMDQFASGLVGTRSPYGVPANPLDPEYVPGGSSSASAVAVAMGLATFALGTDTAGSGRVPAAMNGIVGLKPTKGLLSTTGLVPAAASLDCVAVFANKVEDSERVLRVLAASHDEGNVFSRLPPPEKAVVADGSTPPAPASFRFGVPAGDDLTFCDDEVSEQSYFRAAEALKEIGGTAVEIDFTPFREAAALLYGGPFVAERFAGVGKFIKEHIDKEPQDFNDVVANIILNSEKHAAWELYNAEAKMRGFVRQAKTEAWSKVDFLVVPTIPRPITVEELKDDPVGLNSMLGTYTNFVNLMDYCAIAVPSPNIEGSSVPRGVTFVAEAFEENLLLSMAKKFEQML